ncbi:MAG: hypothetical protein IT584_03295 [Chlamydiae bacterium]|nr:hypothetical protein [Chlamydiota bacterium]
MIVEDSKFWSKARTAKRLLSEMNLFFSISVSLIQFFEIFPKMDQQCRFQLGAPLFELAYTIEGFINKKKKRNYSGPACGAT